MQPRARPSCLFQASREKSHDSADRSEPDLNLMRTIFVAVLAICLAAFPAGMSRASAPISEATLQAATAHSHAEDAPTHEHELASAGVDGAAFQAANDEGDCSDHAAGKQCGSTCCGFACHAFQPVLEVTLGVPFGRAVQPDALQEQQVGSGLPFAIERPPRSA